MVVDYQWHWFPETVLEFLESRSAAPRTIRSDGGWAIEVVDGGMALPLGSVFIDLGEQFAAADADGIDVLVVGCAILGEVSHLPADEAVEIAKLINGAYAAAQASHPDRIVPLALVPIIEPARALEVIDHAAELGFTGVNVLTGSDGAPIASKETLPIYQRLDELGMPVVLHPGLRSNTVGRGDSMRVEAGLGWMYQTARAAITLIDSGTLDRCPNLTILHPHLGGVLPYIVERVDWMRPPGAAELPMREYLRTRFYTDCVAPTPGALQLAIRTYGLDRILFGTDFPFVEPASVKRSLEENAEAGQAEAIYANRLPGLKLPG